MSNLEAVEWSSLPAPADDSASAHLPGMRLPSVPLAATKGERVDIAVLSGLTVTYAYPMTGQPSVALPEGWDAIPGARGYTLQACAFRDHAGELRALAVDHLFGLSTQVTAYQEEAARRLHLAFALLSDADLIFANALRLPTMTAGGMTLLKRLTLIVWDGVVRHVFYPVFPPDQAPHQVIDWLTRRRRADDR